MLAHLCTAFAMQTPLPMTVSRFEQFVHNVTSETDCTTLLFLNNKQSPQQLATLLISAVLYHAKINNHAAVACLPECVHQSSEHKHFWCFAAWQQVQVAG